MTDLTPIPRTVAEIVARIQAVAPNDFFGAQTSRLIQALPLEDARQFLKEDYVADPVKWEAERLKITEDVREAARDYLTFAWDKANNCRGLSANRSIDHFRGLIWLLGEDDEAWWPEYEFYGKAILVAVSERVGFDWSLVDNDCWTNEEGERGITAKEALGR